MTVRHPYPALKVVTWLLGAIAALIGLVAVYLAWPYVRFAFRSDPTDWEQLGFVAGALLAVGLVIVLIIAVSELIDLAVDVE